jgi:hypothetical protein
MEKNPDVDPSKKSSNTGFASGGLSDDQKELLKIGEISAEIKHERARIAGLKRKLRMENFRRRLRKQTTNATDMVAEFFTTLIHSSTTPNEEAATRRRLQRDMSRRSTNGTTV